MRRTTFALLAAAGAVFACLFIASAAMAQAPAATIDAHDSPTQGFTPSDVSVTVGQTVRWEFDQAATTHTVTATSANWSVDETRAPNGAAVEHTFTDPGTYTFHCKIHPNMTGSVTVAAAADALENVLVFSKTAGFRHDSIPAGIAAIQQLGQQNDFSVTATEDAAQFTDANLANFDVIVFLSTTGDVLDADQQAAFERYIRAGGGFVGIHAAADTEYGWDFYNNMIGASFRNHPAGTPTAAVDITDTDEPSTQGLPTRWTRTDEWYNYQGPIAPAANGSTEAADYSARLSKVHVLATVDESTYGEDDGNTADDDHPISWCSDYEGGRIWYTGMGHTIDSYSDANFLKHILGGLETASRDKAADCGPDTRQAPPTADDFEKVTLDDDTQNPMELDVAPDGRLFYIERDGRVQIWSPVTQQTVTAGTIPVTLSQENGLLGLQLAPDFETSHWVYLFYSQLPDKPGTQVISRFKVNGNSLDMASEQKILTFSHQTDECCHSSGSLYFDSAGNLYISAGDNTNPFASDGFDPIDERPGRAFWDAQRTSANTNDLNGKIMRIKPMDTPTGPPGVGSTYTIPAGNLFAPGTANTRPEIYGMGFRNPFRFTVDPETDWVLMADYGPDAGSTVANRGPQGSVEFNALEKPGNYGWPYCIRQNVAYNDYDFATGQSGPKFNCDAPVNNSPNNTGLTNLPPAIGADGWEGYTETDNRFPGLGTGGAPMGGPRYHYDASNPSKTKFPAFYDDKWFIGEWNNGWLKTSTLDGAGNMVDVDPFPYLGAAGCTHDVGANGCYKRPMDFDFGPDGSLYLIEWGSGFGGDNADSGVYRIDYTAGDRRPIAKATATPDNGPAPLAVQFSSDGSSDPEGTTLTYAWDFDNNGTTDSTEANPSHTYTTAGSYTAVLKVTDEGGLSAVNNVQVVVGNTRPQVKIEIPENGQFAAFGDKIPYKISVTDAEDGTTTSGINCADITLNVSLGHDLHAHTLSSHTGCEGTVDTLLTSGHGDTSNVFTVLEAVYTDKGAPGTVPLTGRDQEILPPKRKQAEFFTDMSGVQTEDTADTGGGKNIGFIENGDWVSYNPVSFKDIRALSFRVASGGAGGNIEVRLDSPTGPLVGSVAVANTGGWQNWTNVQLALDNPPAGTHAMYLVFTGPAGGLFNINWFEAIGKGAAVTEAPQVSADADPKTGAAPLEVHFTGTATDFDGQPGDQLTYAWDFGVAGTNDDTSTAKNPTYTYQRAGTYNATFTATDPQGGHATATVQVVVTSGGTCPGNNLRSDEFDGNQLDSNRWDVIRPDNTRPPTVSGGSLNFPIDNGSLYQTGTSARNIVVQDLPTGAWEVTSKITVDPLTENYQQAGLRIYAGDDNWASVHMIYAGTGRDFEFIYENNGTPRNEAADKLGGIPADSPNTYYVRLASDGTDVRAYYSFDGQTFNQVGRTAPMSSFTNPKIGPVALSDQAATYPVAHFDWIRFNPDEPVGGGGGGSFVDEFDGADLGAGWDVVRRDQQLTVSGSKLNIPAQPGDIYGGRNDAKNLVVRDVPAGPWVATAKINFQGSLQYHQAGLVVRGDDDNFTKLGRLTTNASGSPLAEKFEFIYENAATPRNDAPDSTANLPAGFPADYYLRITSDGTNITGAYSTDGNAWTPVGRAAPLPANAKIGMFAFSNDGAGNPVAAFDSFTLTGDNVGGGSAGPSYDDEFTGAALDKTRWNAIVRENPAAYTVTGGNLTITTEPGDIYTADTVPPPNNFILQSADHAGADWVIETKVDSAVNGGYGQGGLIAYVNGDNYVKLDPIADAGQDHINRVELRTEVNGTPTGPPADPQIAAGTGTVFWLRLTKAGNNYTGEFSRDGTTWTPAGTVANPMASPSFGLFAFGPQADGQGDTVSFDSFTLDGKDPDEPCTCTDGGGSGDEFDSGSLDKTKWNAIVREDPALYTVQNGMLNVTTVNGDIYTNGDPAPTRNFFLQTADHGAADWTIETKVDAHELSNGYEQAGLMVRVDDDNYIKYDIISDDGQTTLNRLELRSEIAGAIQTPQPADPLVPAGATSVTLRLKKTGNSYAAEYSFDGTTFNAVNIPVTNPMADPAFGLFTLGVNSGGGTAHFDYFEVDGDRGGCEEPPPENQSPQIQTASATPTIGFAPLPVQFTAAATDPDAGDTVTYSWDFGDGSAVSHEQNPAHTYTTPGAKTAKLTVDDGKGGTATRNVDVNVLEPDNAQARFRALVFSKTAGFRHSSIGPGNTAIEQLGTANNFQVDHTEDATAFRDDILSHYDVVIWLSTTGDVLNDDQQAAFERYIRAGGGYTGIHAAADTEYTWPFYTHLVGASFRNHPAGTLPNGGRPATVVIDDPNDHSTQGLPAPRWDRVDEWYNYQSPDNPNVGGGGTDYSPRANVHVLISLDESTYDEDDGNTTDDDHPISWCHRYEGGRSWYTGMGHTDDSFTEANYLKHILGGIEVAAGAAPSEDCGVVEEGVPVVQGFADPATGTAPLQVQFSATATDPDGQRLTYRWDFGDGGSSLSRAPRHTYTTPGMYTATVTVKDPDGHTGTDTVEVTVNAAGNQVPMVDVAADPTSGDAPLPVRFQAQGIDPDGPENKLTYQWDFGDGNAQFGRNVRHTYVEPGTYKAKVKVTDAGGASTTSDEITVTVNNPPGNQAPTVQALADPKTGTAPLRVRFTSAASDPDGDALLSVWDFGDGGKAGGTNANHTYTAAGTYNAKVTVTDPGGKSASATVQVVVKAKTAGGAGGNVAQPPAKGGTGGVAGETDSRPGVRLVRSHKVARVLKRGLRYSVSCETRCKVTSVLRIQGQRLGKSNARTVAAGQSRKIVLRLDRTVRHNLVAAMRKAHVRNLKATLILKIRTADGTRTIRKAVLLKR